MEEKFAQLRQAVDNVVLVDGHAHNLVAMDSSVPFLSCFSEATGEALSNAVHTLGFKRGVRDIAELYGTDFSLNAIQEYRRSHGLQSIGSKCFSAAKIGALLIDDGIEFDKKQNIGWHMNFVPVVGRILRIEHLAEKILDSGMLDGRSWTLDSFMEIFIEKLESSASEIVGFKSIVAYRSGLEINSNVTRKEAEQGLLEVTRTGGPTRIMNKNFIDYLFTRTLGVALQFDLPIQIHTGFGDKDLDLRLSNPLHLRSFVEDKRFSKCRIVLLHASYPFSKEASYLASVYPQVYLDFGLAVPKLSVHGMISSVKELLELAPINKVMFSTDACAFPEAFYLGVAPTVSLEGYNVMGVFSFRNVGPSAISVGAKRAREVVFSVLRDACNDGDLSIPEAIEAVKDVFLENAKKFYKISLYVKPLDTETDTSYKSLTT